MLFIIHVLHVDSFLLCGKFEGVKSLLNDLMKIEICGVQVESLVFDLSEIKQVIYEV